MLPSRRKERIAESADRLGELEAWLIDQLRLLIYFPEQDLAIMAAADHSIARINVKVCHEPSRPIAGLVARSY